MPQVLCLVPRTSGGHLTRREDVPSAAQAESIQSCPISEPFCHPQKFFVPYVKVKYVASGDTEFPASPTAAWEGQPVFLPHLLELITWTAGNVEQLALVLPFSARLKSS